MSGLRSEPFEPAPGVVGPVALFVPCYVDQFFPDVGLAAVEVLERFGVRVEFPRAQTCCGQPMSNSGCSDLARDLALGFHDTFAGFEYVVAPSASCVSMVRHHYEQFWPLRPELRVLGGRTFELCEFLHDVLGVRRVGGAFPYRVGLHRSCHGLRELGLGAPSERMQRRVDKVRTLLEGLEGIELCEPQRPDECCGFGGTFAVVEDAISASMGLDRLAEHERAGAEVVTAVDMSCLMHLDGLIRRQGRPLRVLHVAQILAGRKP